MSELSSIRRVASIVVVCAMLLAGWPQPALAKQDWLGWLEEFSGPGPFGGRILGPIGIGEVSVEFLCLNISEKRTITAKSLLGVYPGLKEFARLPAAIETFRGTLPKSEGGVEADATIRLEALNDSLRQLQDALKDSTAFESDLAPVIALVRQRSESLRTLIRAENDRRAFDANLAAFNKPFVAYERDSSALSAGIALGIGRGNANVETKRTFRVLGRNATKFDTPATIEKRGARIASCRRGRLEELRADRLRDGESTRTALRDARRGDDHDTENQVILERRDWQTGLVVGYGNYLSHENAIFPPFFDENGKPLDAPELRVQPLEVLAHAKLSPAIDVGAGLGVAFFHTGFPAGLRPGQEVGPTTKAAFYYVPLSVVVRPGALLWPDKKWASSIGYRVSARRFGNLDAADFGNPRGTFKQSGEMIWGTSLYVDLYTLIGF